MKIAIVGCGNIGSKRVKSIQRFKKTKIALIIGRKKIRQKIDSLGSQIAKKIKAKYFSDIKKALESDVKSIILSTQPNLFLNYAIKILNSKKNLLVEKPLGLNAKEAFKILNTARKNKVYLKTGFNLRYDSGIQLVKKLINSKKIGKIYFIKIDYVNGSVKTNKNNIGALSDIGSHSINLFEFFISKSFNVISNTMQSNEYFKDDNGFITLKSKSVIGQIHYSFVRWENKFSLEISGEKGSISVDSLPKWGKQTVTLSKRVYPSGKPKKKNWYFFKENSWYNEWVHFNKAIKNKSYQDLDEGYITMKNLELIRKKNK